MTSRLSERAIVLALLIAIVVILGIIGVYFRAGDPPRAAVQAEDVRLLPVETPVESPSSGRAAHDTSGRVALLASDPDTLRGTVLHGQATWYSTGPGKGDAAAGPKLRSFLGSGWRGTAVDVCRQGATWINCVRVRLTDWCACSGERIIDLSDEDFAVLNGSDGSASGDRKALGAGVIRVRVSIGAPPREEITQPATDTD